MKNNPPEFLRRLVAGPDASGRTCVLYDGDAPRKVRHASSGHEMIDVWITDAAPPVIGPTVDDPSLKPHTFFPDAGGTRFMINRLPSAAARRSAIASIDTDAATAANSAFYAALPGMVETFEPGGNGMHTSMTIDYGLILEGSIDLELDDNVVLRLSAGDTYVLKRARHNWHPLENVGCVIAVVLIGASVTPPGRRQPDSP